MTYNNIAIFGGAGAIGSALVQVLSKLYPDAVIHAFSRIRSLAPKECYSNVMWHRLDYDDEDALSRAAALISRDNLLDFAITTIGMLHNQDFMPEKALKEISKNKFEHLFYVNTILPALLMKHFSPRFSQKKRTVFASLSARVGSISDNKIGGWYGYRASKAALNMLIKNTAIELKRKNAQSIVVGLHPGTVESDLSKPFQKNVAEHKLFSPEFSANQLVSVINNLSPNDSGKCFAWDGQEILS